MAETVKLDPKGLEKAARALCWAREGEFRQHEGIHRCACTSACRSSALISDPHLGAAITAWESHRLTAEAAALPEEVNRLVDTIRRCNAMLNACGVTLSFNEHDPRIVQAFELLRDQTANAALAANLLERLSRVRGKEGGR